MIHYYYFPLPLLNNIIFLRESVTKQGGQKSLFFLNPLSDFGIPCRQYSAIPRPCFFLFPVWRRRAAAICCSLISFFPPPFNPFISPAKAVGGKGRGGGPFRGRLLLLPSSFLPLAGRRRKCWKKERRRKGRVATSFRDEEEEEGGRRGPFVCPNHPEWGQTKKNRAGEDPSKRLFGEIKERGKKVHQGHV